MALDHEDLGKLHITAATDKWLTIESLRTGQSKKQIAREELHKLALKHARNATLLAAAMKDEDLNRDSRGRRYDSDE